MKKTIALGIAILISIAAITGCNGNDDDIDTTEHIAKIYTFSGASEFITIYNGVIILTSELEQFAGGELSFKGEVLSGVRSYRTEFYFYLNGDKTVINSSIVSIEGSEEGISISPDLGTTSSEKMFNKEVWGIITETEALHFSLSGTFMNGETFEYNLTLNVNEVYSTASRVE